MNSENFILIFKGRSKARPNRQECRVVIHHKILFFLNLTMFQLILYLRKEKKKLLARKLQHLHIQNHSHETFSLYKRRLRMKLAFRAHLSNTKTIPFHVSALYIILPEKWRIKAVNRSWLSNDCFCRTTAFLSDGCGMRNKPIIYGNCCGVWRAKTNPFIWPELRVLIGLSGTNCPKWSGGLYGPL